jgi:hypothetical protein
MTTLPQEAPPRNRSNDPEPIIVAEWPAKHGETVRVSLENYKGTWLISLRKWFIVDNDEKRPGKGISLSVKHLPRVTEAVGIALTTARERGLIPSDQDGDR